MYCTFWPVGGLPQHVNLLEAWRRLGGVGFTHRRQQHLQALQELLGELVFPRSSFVQLLQLGWREPKKLLTQRIFLKLATTNQEEELTEDLCGVGLVEGHSIRLGEVDVGAGLSEGS